MKKSYAAVWIGASIALVLFFFLSMALGSVHIGFGNMLTGQLSDIESIIVFDSRLPRSLAAVFSGGSLALAGLFMQTLFRNPLAGPSVLGISSGAGLAVALITLGGFTFLSAQVSVVLAAVLGSFAVLAIILAVAKRFYDVNSVLIVGLMLSFFASAIIGLLQSFATESALRAFVFWGFGSFAGVHLRELIFLLIPTALVLALSPAFIKPLNALLLGEQHASSMGIEIGRLRLRIMLATGVLTGTVTAFCGPIAFIGLAAPHIARFIFRTVDHKIILPGSILLGSVLALICDIIARLPGLESALPLNTVCAFMGAPIVIYLIFAGRTKKFLL